MTEPYSKQFRRITVGLLAVNIVTGAACVWLREWGEVVAAVVWCVNIVMWRRYMRAVQKHRELAEAAVKAYRDEWRTMIADAIERGELACVALGLVGLKALAADEQTFGKPEAATPEAAKDWVN